MSGVHEANATSGSTADMKSSQENSSHAAHVSSARRGGESRRRELRTADTVSARPTGT